MIDLDRIQNQDFEIISLNDEDYRERMNAIDHISDRKVLEEIFTTEEYLTVRMKAYDRLVELFGEENKKVQKMLEMWKTISNEDIFWIPLIIRDLRSNNNIEKNIKYLLDRTYGYPFDDFWCRWHTEKRSNKIISKVVDVCLNSIKWEDGKIEYRTRSDGFGHYFTQYHYEMVIKILQEKDGKLVHDYVYVRCWNAHEDTNQRMRNEFMYEGDSE